MHPPARPCGQPLATSALSVLLVLTATATTAAAHETASGEPFEGAFVRGAGNTEYLQLLDVARQMYHAGTPALQSVPMLYDPATNGMLEGPTWHAWWTQNSYGPTFAALPFLPEPLLTFTQTSHDWWFDNIGNGTRADKSGDVAPDGCLCDDGEPTNCNYKQGDGNVPLHDWTLEESLSAVVMEAELLLTTRDVNATLHKLPLFLRTSNLLETRRDTVRNMFLGGPSSNLLAPSFGGWLQPNGVRAKAYLTGLSVTYAHALNRLIELEAMVGDPNGHVALYTGRRDATLAGLPSLLAPNGKHFVKSMDQNGTLHGVPGQREHGYLEAVVNHDAVAMRGVVNATMAETIVATLMAEPGLRPYNFTITQYPGLDDMVYPDTTWLWQFGTWVNGGAWSTCEARMMLAYARTGRVDQSFTSMRQMMSFANDWRMDNPLVNFGSQVYQPKEPINIVIDNYGVPAALIRGMFEFVYTASTLTLVPHIPASLSDLAFDFPVRWGHCELYVTVDGAGGQPITAVVVNGAPLAPTQFNSTEVVLVWTGMPPPGPTPPRLPTAPPAPVSVNVTITLGGGSGNSASGASSRLPAEERAFAPSHGSGEDADRTATASPGVLAVAPNCTLSATVQAQLANLTTFKAAMASRGLSHLYEAAHADYALDFGAAWATRCAMLGNGTLAPLQDPASQAAADTMYATTVGNLAQGLYNVLQGYAASADPVKQAVYAAWTHGTVVGGRDGHGVGYEARLHAHSGL